MEKKLCSAIAKSTGKLCRRQALENGKCKNHGGKSTGPKDKDKHRESLKGNKNAVKTGEYETIVYETLSDEEKELYERVATDPAKQVNGRYKILEIRTFRLMTRYSDELKKKRPDEELLERLEHALTRIDARAAELIRENRALSDGTTDDDNNSIDQLITIVAQIRDKRLST